MSTSTAQVLVGDSLGLRETDRITTESPSEYEQQLLDEVTTTGGSVMEKRQLGMLDLGSRTAERRNLRSHEDMSEPPEEAPERGLKLIIPRHIRNISICVDGKLSTRDFDGPSYWNRYFSMISMSSIITGGTFSMAKLHSSRCLTYRAMFAGLAATFLLKYSLKVIDICSGCCGHQYVQLWNGGRTTIDKMIESLMIHGVSIVFTLAMQLTLCTLFLTFWTGEYFVMSYIPGIGFVAFFGSFAIFTVGMVCDRVKQVLLHSRDRAIFCFWFIWVVWMGLVAVPMIGYCVYILQFVMEVKSQDWMQKQPFSPEFQNVSVKVCNAVYMFTTIGIIELLIILKMDLEEGKGRRAK